jgi:hypothetical protein
MKRPATDSATRERALRLAKELGAAEAARQSGVPAATIRSWLHRAGESGPPAGADPENWASSKEAGARQAWQTAHQALGRVRELLDAGKTADAQRAALTFAILIDKSGVLETAAQAAQQRQAKLTEAQAHEMHELLVCLHSTIGTDCPEARKLLASLLRQAGAKRAGEPFKPDPELAAAARAAVRTRFGIAEVVEAAPPERLALPAPRPHPDGEAAERSERASGDGMAAPKRIVRAARERRQKRGEAVTGEVVDWRPANSGQGAVEEAREQADPEAREAAIHWSNDPDVWRPV